MGIHSDLWVALVCGALVVAIGNMRGWFSRPAQETPFPTPLRSEESPKKIILVHFPKDEPVPETEEERKSREFLAAEAERVKNERDRAHDRPAPKPPFKQTPSTLVH